MADVYRFLKDVFGTGAGLESYAIYSSSGNSQGDMMQWDAGSRVATNNALGSGSIFLGVSEEANPLAGLGTTSRPLTGARQRIRSSGIHFFKTTSGDTYAHLQAVYQGADVQTVTNGASANRIIGRVWLPDGTTVTGGTTTTVPVLIYGSMTQNSTVPSSADAAR